MFVPTKTALITGATGGLGREFCRELAARGYSLVITARCLEKLERLATKLRQRYAVSVHVIAADLNDSAAPAIIHNQLGMCGISVDLFINNAGLGLGRAFVDSPWEKLDEMIQVNMGASTFLLRLLLPDMLARKRGAILNIASTGSFVPGPMNAVYCASKAYILHLSEALSAECAGTAVRVCALCPGATHTGFAHRADMETTRLFNRGVMHPRQVAREGYLALLSGRPVTVAGRANKAMMFATRLLPRRVVTGLSGRIQAPMGVFGRYYSE